MRRAGMCTRSADMRRLAVRAAVTLVASFAEGEWNVLILDHMLDLPLHREHKERNEVPVTGGMPPKVDTKGIATSRAWVWATWCGST